MELLFTFRTILLSRLLLSTENLSLNVLGLVQIMAALLLTLIRCDIYGVQLFRASEMHALASTVVFVYAIADKHHLPFALLNFRRKCPT